MRRKTLGSIVLIDGMAALLLIMLIYVGAQALGSEIERVEGKALEDATLIGLRNEILQNLAGMNMTLQPDISDSLQIGRLRFFSEPPGGASQSFFISGDEGVRVFYISEKG